MCQRILLYIYEPHPSVIRIRQQRVYRDIQDRCHHFQFYIRNKSFSRFNPLNGILIHLSFK